MKKIITKMTAFTAVLAALAILIVPQLSSAENYVSIPDNTIMISVLSSNTARITWYTSMPTTSSLWYSAIPGNSAMPVQYLNSTEGYANSHSVIISGIDLVQRHTFRVGGTTQDGMSTITSGDQGI